MSTLRIAMFGLGVALAAAALGLGSYGPGADGWLRATRWTARASVVLFATVFAARELVRLTSGSLRRLLSNRRGLGLAFAAAHLVHAACFTLWFVVSGERPAAVTLAGGGLAYAFILAMAVTSTNAAQRALGPWWGRLHWWGLHYVWLIFLQSYLGRLLEGGERAGAGVFGLALLLTAAGVRLNGRVRRPATTARA